MRLVLDHSAGARDVRVPCYKCGKMHRLADSLIDAEGPAFAAYYCTKECAGVLQVDHRLSCGVYGCAMCPGNKAVTSARKCYNCGDAHNALDGVSRADGRWDCGKCLRGMGD